MYVNFLFTSVSPVYLLYLAKYFVCVKVCALSKPCEGWSVDPKADTRKQNLISTKSELFIRNWEAKNKQKQKRKAGENKHKTNMGGPELDTWQTDDQTKGN